MANRIVSASFLLATLFFSCAIVAADFDFFYYVLMWPGAYCTITKRGCCLPTTGEPALDFFIRGLYTYDSTGEAVTKCNGTSFDFNELEDLLTDLYAYWPNIKCPSNNGRSNWKTYGECSGLTEEEYFSKALQLHSKLDLLSKLSSAGIAPTNGNYSSASVEAAVNEIVGQKSAVRCGQTSDKTYQLYEIWLCVDKDASTIIPCPVLPSFTCGQQMQFSSFTSNMMNDTSLSFNLIQMPTTLVE